MSNISAQGLQRVPDYHDVVVVGNGPSSLALSFMLSGNHPYYHPPLDSPLPSSLPLYLHLKLCRSLNVSLLDQDLEYLSEGVFGRSNNPISNLFDSLNHPGADLDEKHPSLLEWRPYQGHNPVIDHVVLGRGPIGGLWQDLSECVLSVSPATWLQLPGLSFSDWLGEQVDSGRVSAFRVATYYEDYARLMHLTGYFRSGCVVESVKPLSREQALLLTHRSPHLVCHACHSSEHSGDSVCDCFSDQFWLVEGTNLSSPADSCSPPRGAAHATAGASFCYVARAVVLACGAADAPVRLEDLVLPAAAAALISHSPPDVNKWLENSQPTVDYSGSVSQVGRALPQPSALPQAAGPPLLVVGAGLSAADTVLHALSCRVPVLHVFRRHAHDARISCATLPLQRAEFADYRRLLAAMRGQSGVWSHYRALPQTRLAAITAAGWATLVRTVCGDSEARHHRLHVRVSHVAVLIGCRPSLSFLHITHTSGDVQGSRVDPNVKPSDLSHAHYRSGGRRVGGGGGGAPSVGVDSSRPVNSRTNPVNCDVFSHQVVGRSRLYAVGPLVGDNLVRFLQGSAAAVVAALRQVVAHSNRQPSLATAELTEASPPSPNSDSGCCSEDGA